MTQWVNLLAVSAFYIAVPVPVPLHHFPSNMTVPGRILKDDSRTGITAPHMGDPDLVPDYWL